MRTFIICVITFFAICAFQTCSSDAHARPPYNINPPISISGPVDDDTKIIIINRKETKYYNKPDHTARNVAYAAIGIAVVAVVIGLVASEHNQGQVRIARF